MSDRLEEEIIKRLNKVGFLMVSEIRKNLNTPQKYIQHGPYFRGLEPSLPGEFPRKLSGQLIKSIAFKVDEKEQTCTVGTSLEYGRFLEMGTKIMKARPWLVATLHKVKTRVLNILKV